MCPSEQASCIFLVSPVISNKPVTDAEPAYLEEVAFTTEREHLIASRLTKTIATNTGRKGLYLFMKGLRIWTGPM